METIQKNTDYIKISMPGGTSLQCPLDSYKEVGNYGLKLRLIGCGITLAYTMVLPLVKPLCQLAGEKLKDKVVSLLKKDTTSEAKIVSGEQINISQAPISRFIIPNVLRENDICVIFSPEKTGKTTLGINWSCSINAGVGDVSLPIYSPLKVPVIYYNMEMDDWLLREFYGKNPNFANLSFVNKRDWQSTDELLGDIKQQIEKTSTSTLVVIDNLTASGLNSTGEAAREFLLSLRKLQENRHKKMGVYTTFVLITHTVKDAKLNKIDSVNMRGSNVLTCLADVTLGLSPAQENGHVLLKVVNVRSAAKPELCYLMERVSLLGNHHFKFIKMTNEYDKTERHSTELHETKDWREVPEDDKDIIRNFWKEEHKKGLSPEKIATLTLEIYNICVTRQTIYNFFNIR